MIVGLIGYAGSGKDSAAEALVATGDWTRVSFADPLRAMALAINPWVDGGHSRLRLATLVSATGWTDAKKNPEVRRLLQAIGTEAVRDIIGADTWINIARWSILDARLHVVITDCRFQNEIELVREMGGTLARITRPGCGAVNAHVSESLAGTCEVEVTVPNNGLLSDLHKTTVNTFCGAPNV